MNIFVNYKTTKLYVEYLLTLPEDQKEIFSEKVKEKFFQKVTSDIDLDSYKITVEDLKTIINGQNENNLK